jgi:acyl-CoA hydrolase
MSAQVTVEKAIESIQSQQRVFVHGGAATPQVLLAELVRQAERLKSVELIHLHVEGHPEYAERKFAGHFRVANLFVGGNMRGLLDYENVDYLPCFLSEIPMLFRSGKRPIDVALIHVSSPDAHGYCSLGVSVDIVQAAVSVAKRVIAQVNPRMPRVHGGAFIHTSKIDWMVAVDEALPEAGRHQHSEEERKIGAHIAGLIEDGSTLQMGIGSIPDAVLAALTGHRHLGIHTEMWSDGALDLILAGVVDNSQKCVHAGKTVSAFMMGSKRLYDFVHDNPSVVQYEVDYVNAPNTIARNPKVVAVNSAVEIDLSGQVCADSVGCQVISGVGGQMDFMRGAALSKGGKPMIAMTSRTAKGVSKIVAQLKPGAGVVTTRAHLHYVITEFGVADVFGMTLRERARELIRIAHPEDRETLERQFYEMHRKACP